MRIVHKDINYIIDKHEDTINNGEDKIIKNIEYIKKLQLSHSPDRYKTFLNYDDKDDPSLPMNFT